MDDVCSEDGNGNEKCKDIVNIYGESGEGVYIPIGRLDGDGFCQDWLK